MIEEIHGKPVKAGESFSAAHIVGYFDTIEEMHKVYDRYKGHTGADRRRVGLAAGEVTLRKWEKPRAKSRHLSLLSASERLVRSLLCPSGPSHLAWRMALWGRFATAGGDDAGRVSGQNLAGTCRHPAGP